MMMMMITHGHASNLFVFFAASDFKAPARSAQSVRPAGRTDWALRAGALKSEAAKKTNRLLACPCVIIIIIILLVLLTHARLSAVADAGWTDDPLSRGQNKLNLTSVQRILTIGCIACRAVIEVW